MGRPELDTANKIPTSPCQPDRIFPGGEVHYNMVIQTNRSGRRRPILVPGRRRKELHYLGRSNWPRASIVSHARSTNSFGERVWPASQEEDPMACLQMVFG